jgi:galacturonosyltransferase
VVAGRGSIFLIQNYFKRKFYEGILKIFLNKNNYICFINPEDKNFFLKKYQLNKKKVFFIPSEGINIRHNNKKKNRKINFIFFARILKEKGIDDYLEAAKIINKKHSNTNFYVAGPSQKKNLGQTFSLNFKDYMLLLKKNKFVKYLGYIKNYKKIFFKIDCLVAPSFTEGAGNSVLEAMSSRLFIIAYNNAGHRFVLKNTKNLVCKKNNVQELVKNIEKFINIDKRQLNKIALQSQKKVLNYFSTEIVFNKLKKILNSTIKLKY